jgi:zinc protease
MATRNGLTKRIVLRIVLAAASLTLAGFATSAALAQSQGGDDKTTSASKVERLNRAPVNKEILRVKLPRPTVEKLPNGLTLVLLEDHKLPTIGFYLSIRPGQLGDPKQLPGVASFTAGMLREGTAKRTSAQIATEVDTLGANLDVNSWFGNSFTNVTATGLISTAPQILDLMSDVVLNPIFSDDELAKYKQTESATLEQNLSSPDFLAYRAYRRTIYGDNNLGMVAPTKESIGKISSADLKKFHGAHYVPGNSILIVSGDFKTADMKDLVAKYFGAWKGAAEPAITLPETIPQSPSQILIIDRPGSVQTTFAVGDLAIRRASPEYYGLKVMNQILGDGPQARLFLDLREEHSLTYGAYSYFTSEIYPGYWQASSPVRTEVTKDAFDRFTYEFKKINNEPVPQLELDEAHRAIVAAFALSLEQPLDIVDDWFTVQYYELPADYWDKYPDQIFGVNAQGVQAAAKKFVDLDHLQWILVGDRKAIESVAKQYGPVTVVDVNGNPEK